MSAEKTIRLYSEDVTLEKTVGETGRLKVAKRTRTRDAAVDSELLEEKATVETIPKGHQVFEMPVARTEGDTTIIPIVEEVIHVEKRLFLKEEIHITRHKTTKRFRDVISLRHQEAVVSRVQSGSESPAVHNPPQSPRRKRAEKSQSNEE